MAATYRPLTLTLMKFLEKRSSTLTIDDLIAINKTLQTRKEEFAHISATKGP